MLREIYESECLEAILGQFLVITLTTLAAAQDVATVWSTEVIYGYKDGLALTFDVFEPDVEPNDAAVVFMVSGGWFSKWNPLEKTSSRIAAGVALVPPCDITNYVWSTPDLNNQYRKFPDSNGFKPMIFRSLTRRLTGSRASFRNSIYC